MESVIVSLPAAGGLLTGALKRVRCDMHECHLCGIDVEEEGLCKECKNEYGKRSIKQLLLKASTSVNLLFSGAVLFVFVALVLAFQVSGYLEAQTLKDMSENLKIKKDSATASAGFEGKQDLAYDITKETARPPLDNRADYVTWMSKTTGEDIYFLQQRWDLALGFVNTKELDRDAALTAFLRTPREHFVRAANIKRAYDDTWLPIGFGATITDPDVVSMMTTSLEVKPHHKVLEIGTGSGYQAAILSHLSNFVFTIEIITPLAIETDQLYKSLEDKYPMYKNIKRKLDDGFYGWEQYAPFDRIIVTCAIDHVPPPLIKQLAIDGIIVAPLGPPGRQQIMQLRKLKSEDNKITITRRDVYNGLGVKFIPFRDKEGVSYTGR